MHDGCPTRHGILDVGLHLQDRGLVDERALLGARLTSRIGDATVIAQIVVIVIAVVVVALNLGAIVDRNKDFLLSRAETTRFTAPSSK